MLLWKGIFHQKTQKDWLRVSASAQSWLDSPGQCTDSLPWTVSLRVSYSVQVAFVVGQLVIH